MQPMIPFFSEKQESFKHPGKRESWQEEAQRGGSRLRLLKLSRNYGVKLQGKAVDLEKLGAKLPFSLCLQ